MDEGSILTLLIITHSERKSFDCLAHHLRPHYTILMCFMCFVVEPQAPLDHAKRNMMGSARVVVAANLLFVPFAAMMLVVNSLFILNGMAIRAHQEFKNQNRDSHTWIFIGNRILNLICFLQFFDLSTPSAAKMRFHFLYFLQGKNAQNRSKNQQN